MAGQQSILEVSVTQPFGSGFVKGNTRDSGNIVTVGTAGKPPQRQTFGAQQQATTLVSAPGANFVLNPSGPGQEAGDKATITNSTITSAFVGTNGVATVTVVCTAVNDFLANQSVKFSNLVNGSAVNELVGVVQAAGLSGTAFTAIITNFVPVTQGVLPTAG